MRSHAARLAIAGAFVASTALAHAGDRGVASAATRPFVRSAAERDFARTVTRLSANDVTADLPRNAGKHVSFVCTVTAIVRADSMIGQCGREAEPIDMYVTTRTAALHIGTKIRVLGEMATPPVWVDATGHPWYTSVVKAEFVDPL